MLINKGIIISKCKEYMDQAESRHLVTVYYFKLYHSNSAKRVYVLKLGGLQNYIQFVNSVIKVLKVFLFN